MLLGGRTITGKQREDMLAAMKKMSIIRICGMEGRKRSRGISKKWTQSTWLRKYYDWAYGQIMKSMPNYVTYMSRKWGKLLGAASISAMGHFDDVRVRKRSLWRAERTESQESDALEERKNRSTVGEEFGFLINFSKIKKQGISAKVLNGELIYNKFLENPREVSFFANLT